MNQILWDVPETEEGFQLLLQRIETCRNAGEEQEMAWGLLKLSHLVKWIRSDNEESPFERSITLANEALEIFRRTGDVRGQIRALCVPRAFMDRTLRAELLAEAEALSLEYGYERELAATWATQGREAGLRDPETAADKTLKALELFEKVGDVRGQAGCLMSLSIRLGSKNSQFEYGVRAAELFRQLGDPKLASRAVVIALLHVDDDDLIHHESMIRQGLDEALATENRSTEGMLYGKLAIIERAMGNHEEADRYQRWEKDVQESDGLTPRERNLHAQEMTKMMLAMAEESKNQEAAQGFQAELTRLENEFPDDQDSQNEPNV